jgi:hypothetical protein
MLHDNYRSEKFDVASFFGRGISGPWAWGQEILYGSGGAVILPVDLSDPIEGPKEWISTFHPVAGDSYEVILNAPGFYFFEAAFNAHAEISNVVTTSGDPNLFEFGAAVRRESVGETEFQPVGVGGGNFIQSHAIQVPSGLIQVHKAAFRVSGFIAIDPDQGSIGDQALAPIAYLDVTGSGTNYVHMGIDTIYMTVTRYPDHLPVPGGQVAAQAGQRAVVKR